MIRERDKNKCVWCPKSAKDEWRMTNSHFWGRGNKTTRFHALNCDTLCFQCHADNEANKQGKYRTWKIDQLGETEYILLGVLANSTGKYGEFEKKLLWEMMSEDNKKKAHLKKGWRGYILYPGMVKRA